VYVKQTPPESDTFSPVLSASPHKKRMSNLVKGLLITFASIGLLGIVILIVGIVIEENMYTMFNNPAHGIHVRNPEEKETQTFNIGETFIFDEFEVTIGDGYDWRVVDYDERSTINGLDVIRIPVTITNVSEETRKFNVYNIKVYCPCDISVNFSGLMVHFYDDDNIDRAGSMRSGATVSDKYIHFFYDGDGYYHVSFETWNKAWEVRIFIEKP